MGASPDQDPSAWQSRSCSPTKFQLSWQVYIAFSPKRRPVRRTKPNSGGPTSSHSLSGFMQDIPQAPSQRHFFFLLLQSSSDEHLRRHFWFWERSRYSVFAIDFIHNYFRSIFYIEICLLLVSWTHRRRRVPWIFVDSGFICLLRHIFLVGIYYLATDFISSWFCKIIIKLKNNLKQLPFQATNEWNICAKNIFTARIFWYPKKMRKK